MGRSLPTTPTPSPSGARRNSRKGLLPKRKPSHIRRAARHLCAPVVDQELLRRKSLVRRPRSPETNLCWGSLETLPKGTVDFDILHGLFRYLDAQSVTLHQLAQPVSIDEVDKWYSIASRLAIRRVRERGRGND